MPHGFSPQYWNHPQKAVRGPIRAAGALSKSLEMIAEGYRRGILSQRDAEVVTAKIAMARNRLVETSVAAANEAIAILEVAEEPREKSTFRFLADTLISDLVEIREDAKQTTKFLIRSPETSIRSLGMEVQKSLDAARQSMNDFVRWYSKASGAALVVLFLIWFGPKILDRWTQ